MKKLFGISFIVLRMLTFTINVFAAKKVYVPTSGDMYDWDDENEKWVKGISFRYTYDKQGRIVKKVWKTVDIKSTMTFSWKGNHIVKVKKSTSDGLKDFTSKFSYKNNLPVKVVSDTGTVTYKWNKRTAEVVQKSGKDKYKWTIKVDKKKRPVYSKFGSSITKYKYYRNGNMKTITFGEDVKYSYKYNSDGYPVYAGEKKQYTTYKYTLDTSKNSPAEMICTYTNKYEGEVTKSKIVYTSYAKVSRIWNCDGFAYQLNPAGPFDCD